MTEYVSNWRRTKRGLITNLHNKMRSRHQTSITLNELHDFSNCIKFNRLFLEWGKSGYKKEFKPSIDRINNKKGYSIDNIQWLSWSDNRHKQTMERRNRSKPVEMILNGEVIKTFKSQREVIKSMGVNQGLLSMVLSGQRNHTGGYQFRYVNVESNTTEG